MYPEVFFTFIINRYQGAIYIHVQNIKIIGTENVGNPLIILLKNGNRGTVQCSLKQNVTFRSTSITLKSSSRYGGPNTKY